MPEIKCSRAGCVEPAEFKVLWRNSKIHAPERVKIWLSCESHKQFLSEYLDSRGFLLGIEALGN